MLNKPPEGKGMLIWMLDACAGGNPQALAQKAKEAGFSWVAIKVQDGTSLFQPTLVMPAISALQSVGIDVWGWGYLYGATWYGSSIAHAEAQITNTCLKDYPISGFLIDAESQYKRKGAGSWATTYMLAVRSSFPSKPLGLCSYRYPSYHPELPWREFLAHCDFHAPQVYWAMAHNPGDQLRRSVRELTTLKDLPVAPVGAAYKEHGWVGPTASELNEFDATAKELKLPGVSYWSWQHAEANPLWWNTIASHEWTPTLPPPPPPLTLEQKVEILWNLHQGEIPEEPPEKPVDADAFTIEVIADKSVVQGFKQRDKAGKPIMLPRDPRIKLYKGTKLKVSSTHKESTKDTGDGIVRGTGEGNLYYCITEYAADPEAKGLFVKYEDVVRV